MEHGHKLYWRVYLVSRMNDNICVCKIGALANRQQQQRKTKQKQYHLYSLEFESNDPDAELPSESKLIKLPVVTKLCELLLIFRLTIFDWAMCEMGFFERFRSME